MLLRVASATPTNRIAGAIAHMVRDSGSAEIQAIGAAAISQAIKGAAVARIFLSNEAIDLVCVPSFVDVTIEGEARTAIRVWCGSRADAPAQSASEQSRSE
jgi:stage V sporulation protein S